MKTTQKTAVNAHNALVEIGRLPFPIRDALSLLKVKKALETAYEFQLQEEQKLVEEYQPTMDNGKLTMPYTNDEEKERAKEFFQKFADLNKMEIEVDIDPAHISIPEGISIKPDTLAALDGFVEWGE